MVHMVAMAPMAIPLAIPVAAPMATPPLELIWPLWFLWLSLQLLLRLLPPFEINLAFVNSHRSHGNHRGQII